MEINTFDWGKERAQKKGDVAPDHSLRRLGVTLWTFMTVQNMGQLSIGDRPRTIGKGNREKESEELGRSRDGGGPILFFH